MSIEKLRQDIARVFYDKTRARRYYGLEQAQAALAENPVAFDECFGPKFAGGMYRAQLNDCVTESFTAADRVVAVLRKAPDDALALLADERG